MVNHYPSWAREFARKYFSKTVTQFILHGNIRDSVPIRSGKGYDFMRFPTFLSDELFGSRDIVLFYDRSGGVHFRDKASMADLQKAVAGLDAAGADFAGKLPKDPVRFFSLLEKYLRLRLAEGKSIAVIIDFAETIVPMSDSASAGTEDRNCLEIGRAHV